MASNQYQTSALDSSLPENRNPPIYENYDEGEYEIAELDLRESPERKKDNRVLSLE